jgi:hypothetical protein
MGTVRTETLFKQGNTAMNVKKHRNGQVTVTFESAQSVRSMSIALANEYNEKCRDMVFDATVRAYYSRKAQEYYELYDAACKLGD